MRWVLSGCVVLCLVVGCHPKVVRVENHVPNGTSIRCYELGDITVVVWHDSDVPEVQHRIQWPGGGCADIPAQAGALVGDQIPVGAQDMVPVGAVEGKLVLRAPAYFANTVVYDVASRSVLLEVEQQGGGNTRLRGSVVIMDGIFLGECSEPYAKTKHWRTACLAEFKAQKHTADIGSVTRLACSAAQGTEVQRMGGQAMFSVTLRVDLDTMARRVTQVSCAAGSS